MGDIVDRLRALELFERLTPVEAAVLATFVETMEVPQGATILSEDEHTDELYVIESGDAVVSGGNLGTPASLGPGEYFGEIALLRDVPRTATIVATADTKLYTLDREEFLGAVTGHTDSRDAADTVVGARLAAAKPPGLALE